jgi:hypothetical protein
VADLTFDFAEPASPDLTDGVELILGVKFSTDEALPCIGVEWRVPNTAPSGPCTFSLWNFTTTGKLAGKAADVTASAGQLVQVLFDTPVELAAGTNYLASVFTPNRYVATPNHVWPQTDGPLTADADNGWFTVWPEDAFPTNQSGNDSNYHVSPILDGPEAEASTRRRRRNMTAYVRGTEGRINDILTILGTTKPSLWPFWEQTGSLVTGIGPGDLTASETAAAAEALEDDFSPVMLPCGLFSYHFHPTGDHHLAGIDHANYSFGNGTVDAAFSVGAWIRPNAIVTNVIMGKYNSAGNLEEWRFFIDSNGMLSLELHDASASATEIAVSAAALTVGQWVHVVATYDGGETAPVVNLYVNGVLANDGATTESGTYTAMEDTAAPLTIGCSGVTATPVAEFHGRIALPFVTGKELSASEVGQLLALTAPMVGVN